MARLSEQLNGGLFTAADPAKLSPGQLSFLRNGVYLPGSQALHRAKGRSQFGQVTATATDVDGLRDIQFDNGDHYLIAMASGSASGDGLYRVAPVGDTGTFSTIASGFVAGSQLDVAHYRNRFYLLNGAAANATGIGSNRVVYLSATSLSTTPTVRQHGMLPVKGQPSVVASGTSFSQTVTGYYEYWVTEVAKFNQDGSSTELESGFSGTPATIFVSSTGMAPLVSLPGPLQNPELTTHWRIYRSPKKEKESDKKFPTGFMISEMGTATANALDSLVVATATAFPLSFNSGVEQFRDFMNAATLSADNGVYASATAGVLFTRSQGCYGYNFGGFAGNVRGITVELQAYVTTAPVVASVTIGRNRNATTGSFLPDLVSNVPPLARQAFANAILKRNTATKSFLVTATTSPGQTVTLGGANDRWLASEVPPLTDTDFSGTFMTVIYGVGLSGSLALFVDYIKTTVHYGGSFDSVIQFPTVAYTFGDIVAQVSKNGPPPSSSTGDLFEDQLVVNDVTNPAIIRWSYPGDPEAFPDTYYIDFETRDNDRVTNIKVVNNRLVVLLETAAYRLNYLPSERDASFDRGKASEVISSSYGCVNEMCAARFSRDGGTEMVAFVSDHGIHGTDGYSFETYTDALDWTQIISRTATSQAIALINDRDRQELLFYFRNDDLANETYMCLHLNYAGEHVEGGRLKVSGPVHMRNFESTGSTRASLESAWSARRTSGAQDIFLGYGGTATAAGAGYVYRETGTTIPAEDSTLKYATRRMFLAEEGMEWRLNEMYGYCGAYTGSPGITYTLNNTKTNDSGPTTGSAKSITLAGQKLHKVNFSSMAEGLIVTAQVTASSFSQENLIFDGEGFGEESSGR